jgi:hypothetical protein
VIEISIVIVTGVCVWGVKRATRDHSSSLFLTLLHSRAEYHVFCVIRIGIGIVNVAIGAGVGVGVGVKVKKICRGRRG